MDCFFVYFDDVEKLDYTYIIGGQVGGAKCGKLLLGNLSLDQSLQ